MLRRLALLTSSTLVLGLGVAQAQDVSQPSLHGAIKIAEGFAPDPIVIAVDAGGPEDAFRNVGQGCYGFVSAGPTFRLVYDAGDAPLFVTAESPSADLTLVIHDPDGEWACDDDSAGNLNPRVTFDSPPTGQYDIWVGTYGQIGATPASLLIGSQAASAQPAELDWTQPALFGEIELRAGFLPDPRTFEVTAGGAFDTYDLGWSEECWSYVTPAPSLRLHYTGGDFPLYVYATADAVDATLVVRDPQGEWLCDDESFGNSNPLLEWSNPQSGQYDIWVGSYWDESGDAVLYISEVQPALPPRPEADTTRLNWDLVPLYGDVDLESGFTPNPHVVQIQAGGPLEARHVGDFCRGYVTPESSYRIFYWLAGGGSLTFSVDSNVDTTLVIADPSGDWYCDDDSGGNFNPRIVFDSAPSGVYDIWVGTYSARDPEPATLYITEDASGVETADLDPSLSPLHGEIVLTDGFTPDPHTVEVTAGGSVDTFHLQGWDECWSYVTSAPSLRLQYTAGEAPLYLYAISDAVDAMLIVRDPQGEWLCDDESLGNGNAVIELTNPQSGQYDLWAGSFWDDRGTAILGFSAAAPEPDLAPEREGDTSRINWDLPSIYGDVDLSSGFEPNPQAIQIQAGGPLDARQVDDSCRGYVTAASSYRIYYTPGGATLSFSVESEVDTTMVIANPFGEWFCDDDSAGGLQPEIVFEPAVSGVYDIWVGTYSLRDPEPATLYIGETDAEGADLDPSLPPLHGEVELSAGFTPDPYTVEVVAGGPLDTFELSWWDDCWSYVTTAPSLRLQYTAGDAPLSIWAQSQTQENDPMLIVRDPQGNWLCDDDSAGGVDPLIVFPEPQSGQYDIWVGDFWGDIGPAILSISETGPDLSHVSQLNWDLPAVFGEAELVTGFTPNPQVIDLFAGGAVSAAPVGAGCYGYVTPGSSYRIFFEAGDRPLVFSVRSEADTTLVVADPYGDWFCDDDSAGNLQPEISFDQPLDGVYDIWVGTFHDGPEQGAVLLISETRDSETQDAPAPVPQDEELEATAPSVSLPSTHGGSKLDAGTGASVAVSVQAGGPNQAGDWAGDACYGWVPTNPAYHLFYNAGDEVLQIGAESSAADIIVLVRTPQGEWICDDMAGSFTPQIPIGEPASGQYDIWVGTYSQPTPAPATLRIASQPAAAAAAESTDSAAVGGVPEASDAVFLPAGLQAPSPQTARLDASRDPLSGAIELVTEFLPDPRTHSVQAGGPASVYDATDGACWGFASEAPNLRIDYTGGFFFPLYVSASSDQVDTVLVIRTPQGEWICDDDSAGNLDSLIALRPPSDGVYDLWVASYTGASGPATIRISELAAPVMGGTGSLDWDLLPYYGIEEIDSEQLQEPISIPIALTGGVEFDFGNACRGYTTSESTFRVTYTGSGGPLTFAVDSEVDTVLVVVDSDGRWLCDDDSAGRLNPQISFDHAPDGVYDVWVGTFGIYPANFELEATVHISQAPQSTGEDAHAPDATQLDWNLLPQYGLVQLAPGQLREPFRVPVKAGGALDAQTAADDACVGYVGAAPDFSLLYAGGSQPLALWVLANADTTLVVSDPEGNWYCDDDSAGAAGPRVTVAQPIEGFYDVWIGAHDADSSPAGTLLIAPLDGPQAPVPETLPLFELKPTPAEQAVGAPAGQAPSAAPQEMDTPR